MAVQAEMSGPGTKVSGRYRLISPLGEGGSGSVWRARDELTGIDIALKLLRRMFADKDTMLAAFAREAELSSRMLSPNVVRVLDRGVDDRGLPFIVYELLEGDELGERLSREGRLSLALCAAVIVQACRALARAHGVGVIHQDVKPENIFLCQDPGSGRPLVKLIDFGLAKMLPRVASGHAESIGGTLEYMAPEILLDGKKPDTRSDLYSLGVVAYECFTGRVPFQGETVGKVLLAHANTTPPKPSSLRTVKAGLADALDGWFARALHRDPAQRFGGAKEMAEAFVDVHRPKASGSVPPPPPPLPAASSHRARASFPSISEIDVTEAPSAPPARSNSGYSVVSERTRKKSS